MDWNITLPKLQAQWKDSIVNVPRLKTQWRDIIIERYKKKEISEEEIEIKIVEVLYDILKNPDLYNLLAQKHAADDDLKNEKSSLGTITSDVLTTWENMDNDIRQKQGISEKVDYFSDDHQQIYAELHATVIRKLALNMKKGKILSSKPEERRKQIEKIIEEEFEKYKKIS
jgi:hypothetical protein